MVLTLNSVYIAIKKKLISSVGWVLRSVCFFWSNSFHIAVFYERHILQTSRPGFNSGWWGSHCIYLRKLHKSYGKPQKKWPILIILGITILQCFFLGLQGTEQQLCFLTIKGLGHLLNYECILGQVKNTESLCHAF